VTSGTLIGPRRNLTLVIVNVRLLVADVSTHADSYSTAVFT